MVYALMLCLGLGADVAALARCEGEARLHFRLDLMQPEQHDVAREVVKVRIKNIAVLVCVLYIACALATGLLLVWLLSAAFGVRWAGRARTWSHWRGVMARQGCTSG
jgi:hypothetical protein